MVYKFFDKKPAGGTIKFIQNQQLTNEIHKPIIRNFKKRKYIHHLKTIFGGLILQISN